MKPKPNFPAPTKINGRLYWSRAELEAYKRAIIGMPPLPLSDTGKLELAPSKEVAKEFGIGRRTLGRRIFAPGAVA